MAGNMRIAILDILFNGRSEYTWNGVPLLRDGMLVQEPRPVFAAAVAELEELETCDIFTDPYADWMFAAGVLEKKLLNLTHLHDDLLVSAALKLYSRLLFLYPSWLDMLRVAIPGTATVVVNTTASAPVPKPAQDRKEELTDMVKRRFGMHSSTADITADELAAELLKREMALRSGTGAQT